MLLGRFYSRYPDVQINLLEESHSVEKQLMLSPNVDFAIYNSTAADPAQTAEYLGQEEIVLVAAPAIPGGKSHGQGRLSLSLGGYKTYRT
ncbi:MAG: LysR substrate-binding domain-containing protein [Enterocloster bolteae]